MTNAEWDAIIEEARKEEPLKKGQLKQSGIINWSVYPNGLLLVEGNGKMVYEEYYTYEWVTIGGGYEDTTSIFEGIQFWLKYDGNPIKYLYVSDGIKEIGADAFSYVSFEELRLPNDLEIIGPCAFHHTCYKDKEEIRFVINELIIPKSLKLLGWNSFNAVKIKKLILPDTVQNLKAKLNENIHNSKNLRWRYSDELPMADEIVIEK